MVRVILLGTGTGVPSLRRGSPCLAVVADEATIIVDTGPGSLRKMLEVGITYHGVDLLLYTHLHPDHTADLVPLLFACKYAGEPRVKDLWCVGGPGFRSHFDHIAKIYGPWITSRFFRLTVEEMTEKPLLFRGITLLSQPVAHMTGSIAYRFDFGKGGSLAVSGDTDYCPSLLDLASEVDLLVLECSFPEGKKVEGHLTPTLAGKIAKETHCKRLCLTHLYPNCDPPDVLARCREVFHGEIILGEDLMEIVL